MMHGAAAEARTSEEQHWIGQARKVLTDFLAKCGTAGFDRHEGMVELGRIKATLGMPSSRLSLEKDLGVTEDELIERMCSR